MTPGYVMGFQLPVAPARLEAFIAEELDHDDIVLLLQDVIEANMLSQLSSQFFFAAQHFVDQGLCTVNGRMLH